MDNVIQISPLFLGLVPLVVGVTQLIKAGEYISSRFIPLFAIGFSMVLTVGFAGEFSVGHLIQGLLVGLSSIGAFAATRSTVQG